MEDCANSGKLVVIAALDGNFKRKPFGSICELVPLCEEIVKLSAVCKLCFNDASFTMRLVSEEKEELIGGEETYMPVCRNCFNHGKSTLCCSNIKV